MSAQIFISAPAAGTFVAGQKITARGWIFLPEGISRPEQNLEVLCDIRGSEDISPTEDQISVSRRTAIPATLQPPRDVSVETFGEAGVAIDFECSIPVSHFRKKENCEVSIQFVAFSSEYLISSRNVCVTAVGEAHEKEAFLRQWAPEPFVTTPYLLVQGEIFAADQRVQNIDIACSGRSLGTAFMMRGAAPQLGSDDNDSPTAAFSYCVMKEDAEAEFLKNGAQQLEFLVTFDSGRTEKLSSHPFRWESFEQNLSNGPMGALESVKRLPNGRLRIEGWCVADGELPELFLRSVRKIVSARDDSSSLSFLTWSYRPDISQLFAWRFADVPSGFAIDCDPGVFGRFPGVAEIVARNCKGQEVSLGPEFFQHELQRYVSEHTAGSGMKDSLKSAASSLLSVAGVTKELPPRLRTVITPQENSFLFVSHNLTPTEGAPRVLGAVVEKLRDENPQATILVCSPVDGDLHRVFDAIDVRVEIVPELSMVRQTLANYRKGQEQLAALMREARPCAVYANTIDSFVAVDAAQRVGIPACWAIHESVDPCQCYPEVEQGLRYLFINQLSLAQKCIFVSAHTEELFRRYRTLCSSAVIPNGVDISACTNSFALRSESRQRLNVSDDTFVVSIIGTTTPRKGQDVFLDGIAKLKALNPAMRIRAFVVGARKGEFLEQLVHQAHTLELGDDVMFVPETQNVGQYFCCSDAIVMASREESAPLVSLEAFAYGVPLVSTSVFGLAEQIRPGETALTFANENSDELAKCLQQLRGDASLRTRLVSAATEDVKQRFSLEHSLATHLAVLHSVVNF